MEKGERIEALELLRQIEIALKDEFLAKFHKSNEERTLRIKFPSGQVFKLELWEEK